MKLFIFFLLEVEQECKVRLSDSQGDIDRDSRMWNLPSANLTTKVQTPLYKSVLHISPIWSDHTNLFSDWGVFRAAPGFTWAYWIYIKENAFTFFCSLYADGSLKRRGNTKGFNQGGEKYTKPLVNTAILKHLHSIISS